MSLRNLAEVLAERDAIQANLILRCIPASASAKPC
jgi:hypothetical protein